MRHERDARDRLRGVVGGRGGEVVGALRELDRVGARAAYGPTVTVAASGVPVPASTTAPWTIGAVAGSMTVRKAAETGPQFPAASRPRT